MTEPLLLEALVIVLSCFAVVTILVHLGISPILGYLFVGLTIGPHGLGLLGDSAGIRFLGELGVVLLMFVVGLEFSLPRMLASRGVVFGLGGLQVGLTMATIGFAAWLLGLDWLPALLVGGAFALSSTAIMLKQLSDQNELGQEHGRLALGIALFQDLAALPLLIIIDGISSRADPGDGSSTLVPVVGAVVFFVSITILARRMLARFIEWIASTRSTELFLLAVLAIILGAAAVAGAAGLSLPIGAFLVGMVIGESDFRHQVSEEVRPFRDILLGLFFLTVGMQINLFVLVEAPILVLSALVAVIGVKTFIVATIIRASGWDLESGLRAGLVLAPSGEFSLLIATQAMAEGLLDVSVGQVVLAATAVSMLLAPFLLQRNGWLAGQLPKPVVTADRPNDQISADSDGHVILCGYGRVAGLVALALQASGKSVLAIEHDIVRLRHAKKEGLLVLYGDATREAILNAAGVDRAGAIVVTFSRRNDIELLLRRIRLSRPELPVIVSIPDSGDMTSLVKAGATHVLAESLAAGLGLAARTLVVLGVPPHEVEAHMATVRCRINPELTEASETGTDTWRQKA